MENTHIALILKQVTKVLVLWEYRKQVPHTQSRDNVEKLVRTENGGISETAIQPNKQATSLQKSSCETI